VVGLDATEAVQLKVSSMVCDATTKRGVHAVAGCVLALESAFVKVQKLVGTSANVYPVSKDELEAARKSGRAY